MKKLTDAKPSYYRAIAWPKSQEEFYQWVTERSQKNPDEHIRLPVTIWFSASPLLTIEHSELGVREERELSKNIHLRDWPLGIALIDRLRAYGAKPGLSMTVTLAGRFLPDSNEFIVFTVFDRQTHDDGRSMIVEVERPSQSLLVRNIKRIHCARGPNRCAKCQQFANEPAHPHLLDIDPEGDYARPTIEIERNGKKEWPVFDILQRFDTEAEARAFADKYGIEYDRSNGE